VAAQTHRQSATTVNYRLRIIIYQEGLYFAFASIHLIHLRITAYYTKVDGGRAYARLYKRTRIKEGLGNFGI
jgi:hypothetical protein